MIRGPPVAAPPIAPRSIDGETRSDDCTLAPKCNMWDRLSLHKLGGWLRKDEDDGFLSPELEKPPQDFDLALDEEERQEQSSWPPLSPKRPSRKAVPGLPRPITFRRQKSEQRDRLVPVELPPTERRAHSADRRGEPDAGRETSPPPGFLPRSSVPDSLNPTDASKDALGAGDSRRSLLSGANDTDEPQQNTRAPPHNPLSMGGDFPPENDSLSEGIDERMLQQEMDKKWILNLSMTFRDETQREKFFITYAEQPNRWRRVTVSCDYRTAPPDSLESDLKSLHYQRDKSARIYESIRDSLPAIQFYETVTNLKLETSDGRLHVHVTEDMNEIIPYPAVSAIDHLQCPIVSESSVRFESHLSGFVYKVKVDGHVYIKKEIPGPEAVEEFLYETNTLSRLQGSSSVIGFAGVIVDVKRERILGLLIDYAENGALVDLMFDLRDAGRMSWPRRERWAKQIVQGLSDIHESGFVQGDFTLSNIVIDSKDDAKIIDINRRGCPVGWEPPELAQLIESGQRIGIYIGVKSDLFQLGMVLWALAEQEDEPERQERPLMVTNDGVPQYFKDIVATCLSEDPRGRLSAANLLRTFPEIDLEASRPTTDSGYARSLSPHRSDEAYIDPDSAVGREDIDHFRSAQGAAPSHNPSTADLSFADFSFPTDYQAGSSGSYILPNRDTSDSQDRYRYSPVPRPTSSVSFDDSDLSNEVVSPPAGREPRWEHVYVDGVTRLVHRGSTAFGNSEFAARDEATVCLPTPPRETTDPLELERPYPADISELADFPHVQPPLLSNLPGEELPQNASFNDRVALQRGKDNTLLADIVQEAETGRSECSTAPTRTQFGPPVHQDSGFHELSHDPPGPCSPTLAQDPGMGSETCGWSREAQGPDSAVETAAWAWRDGESSGVRPVEVSSAAAARECKEPKATAPAAPLAWSFSGIQQASAALPAPSTPRGGAHAVGAVATGQFQPGGVTGEAAGGNLADEVEPLNTCPPNEFDGV